MTSAVILAGGLGTRLRSVVSDLPKPMAPINGKPFLERLINYWVGQGVDHFVLSVGYMHHTVIDYFGNDYDGARIDYGYWDRHHKCNWGKRKLYCKLICELLNITIH